MKSDNEVPRAEDQKKAEELLSNVETFCHSADQGDSYIYESLVERIASALATQRQGFERERRELQARIYSLAEGKTNRIYIYEGSDLEAKELNRLESANSALEERVKELEGAFRSANYSAQTFENECTRLKAKVAELTAELQATRKACDQAHQNTLDREEERDRLKAENVELRKTEDAVLGWTHPNFKWYADKIDTLTLALAEAHGALKPIADLNTSLEQDYVMGMAGVPDCDIISAREAIANKDGQRASEEMKGLRKVVEALKQIADFHVEEDHDLPEEEMRDIAKEALEAYESRGKV